MAYITPFHVISKDWLIFRRSTSHLICIETNSKSYNANVHQSFVYVPLIAFCFRTAFYSALGLRKLKVSTWNPIKIVMGIRNMYKRLARKNISGNMKGEGLVQGGIIIFDKTGTARFAYREETGIEVPIDDIIAVVRHLKAEQQSTE